MLANEYFGEIDLSFLKPNVIVDKFVEDRGLNSINNCMCDSVWDEFCNFCGGNPPMTKQSFHKLLTNNHPLKSKCTSIDGRVCRVLILTND